MKKFIILGLVLFSLFLFGGGSFVEAKDWLNKAYDKSFKPGDGEPYAIDAEATDMFDTKIDLVETGKGMLKGIKDSEKVKKSKENLKNAIKNTEDIKAIIAKIKQQIAELLIKSTLTPTEKVKLSDLKKELSLYGFKLVTATNELRKSIGKAAKDAGLKNADSIFVRMTRYLTKLVVILAIPMLLFISIKVALAFGDEGKMKEAIKQVGFVLGGLLLALFSVMIIYLVVSLTRSNVSLF